MTQFNVDELVIAHGYDEVDRLADFRGKTGSSAILFDAKSGIQSALPIDRIERHSLYAAIEAARASGADQVQRSGQWFTIDRWLEWIKPKITLAMRFTYDRAIDAIVLPRGAPADFCGVWPVTGFDRDGGGDE